MNAITTDARRCSDCGDPIADVCYHYYAANNQIAQLCSACTRMRLTPLRTDGSTWEWHHPDADMVHDTETLLTQIADLGFAVSSAAISRRLTHETCAAIAALVQQAHGELEKEA